MSAQLQPSGQGDAFLEAVARLPPLPRTIVYEDDFNECMRSVKTEDAVNSVAIFDSGTQWMLDVARFDARVRGVARSFLLSSLKSKSPATVLSYSTGLYQVPAATLEAIVMSTPLELKAAWAAYTAEIPDYAHHAIKAFIFFLCESECAAWSPLHRDFAVRALPSPRIDKHTVIRAGDAFLTLPEEARLVRWIDETATAAGKLALRELELACLVVCSYQFGMRPKQLALLRHRDATLRQSAEDGSSIVHLNFRMIKQRDAALQKLPLVRKVKREWAQLFTQMMALKDGRTNPDSFLFGFSSRMHLGEALIRKLDEILPAEGRTAYDLRHSLAQRMVDAGASQEELASALGHSNLQTGLVYFQGSANQAELVNRALGISDTYQAVAKIARERFISSEELAELKGEQQIAGIPHGLPIAGIGGCSTGQPSCPYNPVTACYGCAKFMPVKDVGLHEKVLADFREVVHLYKDTGKGELETPAYLQLRRTIAEVQQVISQLEPRNEQ